MRRLILSATVLILFLLLSFRTVRAIDCGDPIPADKDQLQQYITKCNQSIDNARGQQQTLQAAIGVLNSKISLVSAQVRQTATQIAQLEKDVATLSVVVTDLDKSLNDLTKVFLARVRAGYMRRDPAPVTLFLSSDSFAKFFTKIRYLSIVKSRDQLVLGEMETAKINYDSQKQSKIIKQKQVEELRVQLTSQQKELAVQQKAKAELLTITQNNEKKYQSLLEQAKAELLAVEAVIAGQGSEKEVGDVSQGQTIAHVILGPSCNSNGAHLHFTVAKDGTVQNPFNYLKPVDHIDNSGGDPFNPTGSWDWPVTGTVRFNQGYGETWAIKNLGLWYSSHNGVDIIGDTDVIRAVQPGKLYQGSYSGNNGCLLKYVRVHHKDGGLDTYYLHVNYF